MRTDRQRDQSRPTRRVVLGGIIVVVVVVMIGVLYLIGDGDDKVRQDALPPQQYTEEESPRVAPEREVQGSKGTEKPRSVTKPVDRAISPDTLQGRWFRTDGNYIIEVIDIDAQGHLEAAYYNPRPIHVSKAEAYMEQPIRLFIELQDAGYDGSSYNLTYDVGQDVLRGTYYQAAYGQTYQVVFIRQPESTL